MKNFVVANFSKFFKSARKELYFKLKEQNLRIVGESLYIFLTTPDEVERYMAIILTF